MMEEFAYERLNRRRSFLKSRAEAHLESQTHRKWHSAAAATLLRDAAAITLMLGKINEARHLLRKSGILFFDVGLAGGLQLLYLSGAIDGDAGVFRSRVDKFSRAFTDRERPDSRRDAAGLISEFDAESFRPPHLLRAYQALVGWRSDAEEWSPLRNAIRKSLTGNAMMPVGPARMTLATYLATFDQLAEPEAPASDVLPGGMTHVLNSIVQRRAELLMAARRDKFHWKALLRPAELVDFDLVALLLAGVRSGQSSDQIASAFGERDEITVLPHTLAIALGSEV